MGFGLLGLHLKGRLAAGFLLLFLFQINFIGVELLYNVLSFCYTAKMNPHCLIQAGFLFFWDLLLIQVTTQGR